jgi:hypothetical protein
MLGRLYKRTGNASASMSDTLRALHRIQVLVTEQSAILRDTTNASSGVSSTNQTGGITAGSIDTVVTDCQTDRTRFLKPLQQFYAQGFDIRQRLYQSNITDSQIDAIVSDSDIWYNQVIAWLTSSMGKPAADRFQDTSGSAIRYNISPGGTHQPGEIDKASNYLTSLNRLLANLETLMTSNHFDPLGN